MKSYGNLFLGCCHEGEQLGGVLSSHEQCNHICVKSHMMLKAKAYNIRDHPNVTFLGFDKGLTYGFMVKNPSSLFSFEPSKLVGLAVQCEVNAYSIIVVNRLKLLDNLKMIPSLIPPPHSMFL